MTTDTKEGLRALVRGAGIGFVLACVVHSTALLGTLGVALVVGGCPTTASTVPPAPPAAAKNCPAACERMRAMHCPLGNPTPLGTACEEVCGSAETGGSDWLGCVSAALSCEAMENCSR